MAQLPAAGGGDAGMMRGSRETSAGGDAGIRSGPPGGGDDGIGGMPVPEETDPGETPYAGGAPSPVRAGSRALLGIRSS
jgi:hypothetical protein